MVNSNKSKSLELNVEHWKDRVYDAVRDDVCDI